MAANEIDEMEDKTNRIRFSIIIAEQMYSQGNINTAHRAILVRKLLSRQSFICVYMHILDIFLFYSSMLLTLMILCAYTHTHTPKNAIAFMCYVRKHLPNLPNVRDAVQHSIIFVFQMLRQ